MNDIFDVTKGLLAQGADINYQMEGDGGVHLKRRRSVTQAVGVGTIASAMFILEECFNAEPEFRAFAIEIEPLVKRPTRKIEYVQLPEYLYKSPKSCKAYCPYPSAEECDMLWPLIEKWDNSGSHDDRDALTAAVVEVWRAHNPGVRLRKRRSQLSIFDESDDDDGDDDDSDDDDGDDGDEDVDNNEEDDDEKNDEEDKNDESPST